MAGAQQIMDTADGVAAEQHKQVAIIIEGHDRQLGDPVANRKTFVEEALEALQLNPVRALHEQLAGAAGKAIGATANPR